MSLPRVVVVLSLAALACRGTPAGAPASPGRAPAIALDLAAFVPADTSAAVFVERAMFDHPFTELMSRDMRAELARAFAEGWNEDSAEAEDTADVFLREIGRALGDFDEAALRQAGWISGKSEMALYMVGLVPVFRLHVDGPKVEALMRRAALTAGITIEPARWKDRAYLKIALDDDSDAQVMIAVAPDQVVMAIAGQPESILDHVTSFQPLPGPSLATAWDIGDDDRFLYLDPARLGRLVSDRREMAHLIGDADLPAGSCLAAISGVLTALPRTTSAIQVDDTSLAWDLAFDLSAETAALFKSSGLPGWTKERDLPALRFGFGAAPYPLLMRTGGFLDAINAADVACGDGDGGGGPNPLRAALAWLAPLRAVDAFSFEMVSVDGREVTMSAAVAVNDLPALWSLMAGAMPPLGTTVPAIGDVRDLSSFGMPATIAVGRGLLVGSMGVHHGERARTLLAAEPGPRVPLLGRFDRAFFQSARAGRYVFMGQPLGNEDKDTPINADSIMDARFEGTRLVIRAVFAAH